MENKNVSSIDITPTSTFNALASNTQTTLATAGSVTNDRGKQPETLTLRKRNVDDKKKVTNLGSFFKT